MLDPPPFRIGLQLHRIGVQQDAQLGCFEQVAGARRGEALAQLVEAPQCDVDPRRIEPRIGDPERAPRHPRDN